MGNTRTKQATDEARKAAINAGLIKIVKQFKTINAEMDGRSNNESLPSRIAHMSSSPGLTAYILQRTNNSIDAYLTTANGIGYSILIKEAKR